MQRIVSLLPSTTEIACALGLQDQLVGRSHECDHPPGVAALPALTAAKLDADRPSGEIDRSVRDLVARGLSVYRVDAERLRALAPDVILTQDHCKVCAASLGDVDTMPPDEWVGMINVNLVGTYHVTRAVWPHMRAQGSGSIIMVSSGSGRRAHAGWSAYCASKFGVMGLANSLSKEGRPYGIRCNIICPGPTDTDQRGSNFPGEDKARLLAPEDCVVQSMTEASPVKWNIAHTTWFFEHFALVPRLRGDARDRGALPRPGRGLRQPPGLADAGAAAAE